MINQNLLLAGEDAYNLTKSLRFRASASAYLSRTPASASNQQIWTWSGWVKRGALSYGESTLFNAGTTGIGTNNTGFLGIRFTVNDQLDVTTGATDLRLTTQVFRDPSAWYHIVVAFDTTQATGANRVKVYVNGTQVTAYSGTDPSLNLNTAVNNTYIHEIARTSWNGAGYFDGYMAEINLIDGQALTPSSFGETDVLTGVWKPKKYAGTYGTNGFYLPFTDVATTSGSNAGLGKDFSGNGNYWNTNNISVTAGTTYDSMNDVPTLTSATTANYCVLNPLIPVTTTTAINGNLGMSGYNPSGSMFGTVGVSSGKWYFEYIAYADAMGGISGTTNGGAFPGAAANAYTWDSNNATKYSNGSGVSYGSATSNGDIVGVAFDLDTGSITFYKNNVSQGTAYTFTPSGSYFPAFRNGSGTNTSVNFGQRPFSYTPPTGFVALNTFNLPEPSIKAGNKHMDATVWSGDNTTPRSIANSGSFQPDFVWIKSRSNAYQHNIYDSVRGAGSAYALSSDQTSAEGGNSSTYGYLSAFNSTGFQVTQGTAGGGGAPNGNAYTNQSGSTYVGWQWKANGTGVTNTAGSITSTVSANPTAGFSVVTYTGTGSAATIGHGLGVAPNWVIVKQRNASADWVMRSNQLAGNDYTMILNNTSAQTSYSPSVWNNTAPTSSVFSIGTNSAINTNGNTYVAYCFAEVAGYSKAFRYTGNGSTDGTFVYLGFRPKYWLIKRVDSTGNWITDNSVTSPYNYASKYLLPNTSDAEGDTTSNSAGQMMDILSNGFKLRNTNAERNASGGTYVGIAFAENPFKYANAR